MTHYQSRVMTNVKGRCVDDAYRKVAEDKTEEKVCSAGVQTEVSEV